MTKVEVLPVQVLKIIKVATVVFALLMVWAVLPTGHARAAGMSETQIQAVLSLLSSFGTDSTTVANVNIALHGGGPQDMKTGSSTKDRGKEDEQHGMNLQNMPLCVTLAKTLKKGSQGDDVKTLQEFLMNTGDLNEASSTTYFGEKTKKALLYWQLRMGIISSSTASSTDPDSGAGNAGPLTRKLIISECMKLKEKFDDHSSSTMPRPPRPHQPTTTPTTNTGASVSVTPVDLGKTVALIGSGILVVGEGISDSLSQVGSGTAAAFDAYLSLFEM